MNLAKWAKSIASYCNKLLLFGFPFAQALVTPMHRPCVISLSSAEVDRDWGAKTNLRGTQTPSKEGRTGDASPVSPSVDTRLLSGPMRDAPPHSPNCFCPQAPWTRVTPLSPVANQLNKRSGHRYSIVSAVHGMHGISLASVHCWRWLKC